jgi:hypothetical protein
MKIEGAPVDVALYNLIIVPSVIFTAPEGSTLPPLVIDLKIASAFPLTNPCLTPPHSNAQVYLHSELNFQHY